MIKRFLKGTIGLVVLLLITNASSCDTPPEQLARNSIGAATGAIAAAQKDYTAQCTKDQSGKICGIINRAVDSQNAAITALATACSIPVSTATDPATKCVLVKSALPALQIAVQNMNQFIAELKAATKTSRVFDSGLQVARLLDDAQRVPFQPMRGDVPLALTPGAISLAILGIRYLLDGILKGEIKDIADDSIDAAQGALDQFGALQGTDVTAGQLQGLRLHKIWPDTAPPLPLPAAVPAQTTDENKT